MNHRSGGVQPVSPSTQVQRLSWAARAARRQQIREAAAAGEPVAEIAHRYGLTLVYVNVIVRAGKPAPPRPPRPRRRRLRRRPPAMLARLGREPDEAIGRDYGLTRQRVHQLRRTLGIAARARGQKNVADIWVPYDKPVLCCNEETLDRINRFAKECLICIELGWTELKVDHSLAEMAAKEPLRLREAAVKYLLFPGPHPNLTGLTERQQEETLDEVWSKFSVFDRGWRDDFKADWNFAYGAIRTGFRLKVDSIGRYVGADDAPVRIGPPDSQDEHSAHFALFQAVLDFHGLWDAFRGCLKLHGISPTAANRRRDLCRWRHYPIHAQLAKAQAMLQPELQALREHLGFALPSVPAAGPAGVAVPAAAKNAGKLLADTFSISDLRGMTGLSISTLRKYARKAGAPTAPRGVGNHRFSFSDTRKILERIVASSTDGQTRTRCQGSLQSLDNRG